MCGKGISVNAAGMLYEFSKLEESQVMKYRNRRIEIYSEGFFFFFIKEDKWAPTAHEY